MNVQDSVNQILGMTMIAGKLSGVQEARARIKLSNTIGSLEKGLEAPMAKVDTFAELTDNAAERHAAEQTPGSAMNAALAEGRYQRELEGILPTQKTIADLKRELMLKDPTEANVKATVLADRAIERTQGRIRSAIERRENYTKFAKEASAKSKDIRETILAGGKPDGK